MTYSRARTAAALAATLATLTLTAGTAAAGDNDSGFKTSSAPMMTAVAPGVTVEPIITVGDTLASGYRFESIPDGIALVTHGKGTVDLYVNHETSTVPFPAGFNDFTNAMLSRLRLNQHSRGVLSGELVIPSEANYQRFCSNFLVTAEHGVSRPLILTNEEATDFVYRTGTAWPVTPGDPAAEQAGVVVAYDVKSGAYRTIYGMGRHNHENSVAIPGYDDVVVLSGDDTFSAPASQMYLYKAAKGDALWNDEGHLYAFVGDNPAVNDYGDLTVAGSISGTFIPVPDAIADGGQNGLEAWSNANNVFQFIRIEDIAYDRNTPNVVYFADTGEPRAKPHPTSGRLFRSPTGGGPYPNGRIFRMELDPDDPLTVTSLSILVDGDAFGAASAGNTALIHQPDNVETTASSLLIQEDPGSQNQYPATSTTGTTSRLIKVDLAAPSAPFQTVARVDQSLQPTRPLGAWENSGVIDASSAFGPGAFLVDVQAGTLIVESQTIGGITYEREGGQLLLVRIPGA